MENPAQNTSPVRAERSGCSRRDFLQLGTVAAAGLLPLAAFWGSESGKTVLNVKFDQNVDARLTRTPFAWMVLGNSMVNLRLARLKLKRLYGSPVGLLAEGGTRSLHWYLNLKNRLPLLPSVPKAVVILYRDYDFTDSARHLEGRFITMLEENMLPGDEPLYQMAVGEQEVDPLSSRIASKLNPQAHTLKLRSRLNHVSLDTASLGQATEIAVEAADAKLFSLDNLRGDLVGADSQDNASLPSRYKVFQADPNRNLLTRFVAQAKSMGTTLIFYRVRRRPEADGRLYEPPELQEYTAAFAKWAGEQGCYHVDESPDTRITLDMFSDGDHLKESVRETYTEWFFERLRSLLPEKPTGQLASPDGEAE